MSSYCSYISPPDGNSDQHTSDIYKDDIFYLFPLHFDNIATHILKGIRRCHYAWPFSSGGM